MTISPALFCAVIVTVVRARKIRTTLRTYQIAGFVTLPSWKKSKDPYRAQSQFSVFWSSTIQSIQLKNRENPLVTCLIIYSPISFPSDIVLKYHVYDFLCVAKPKLNSFHFIFQGAKLFKQLSNPPMRISDVQSSSTVCNPSTVCLFARVRYRLFMLARLTLPSTQLK